MSTIAPAWTKQLHTTSLQACKLKTDSGQAVRGRHYIRGADLLLYI